MIGKIVIQIKFPFYKFQEGFDFSKGHYGVDLVLKERTPIKAVYDGIVLFAEWTLNYGFTVVVFHKNELISTYKHNESRINIYNVNIYLIIFFN